MLLYGYVFKHYFSLRATSPFAGFARSHARTAREKGLKSLRKSLKPVSKKLITLKKIRCGAKPTWSVQTTSFIFKKEIATKQNKIKRNQTQNKHTTPQFLPSIEFGNMRLCFVQSSQPINNANRFTNSSVILLVTIPGILSYIFWVLRVCFAPGNSQ